MLFIEEFEQLLQFFVLGESSLIGFMLLFLILIEFSQFFRFVLFDEFEDFIW